MRDFARFGLVHSRVRYQRTKPNYYGVSLLSLKNMWYMPRTNRNEKKRSDQTSSAGDERGDEGGDPLLLLLVCRVVCLQARGEQLLQQQWPPEVKLWHFPPCGQLQCSPLRLPQVLIKPRKTTGVHWWQREGGLLSLVNTCGEISQEY